MVGKARTAASATQNSVLSTPGMETEEVAVKKAKTASLFTPAYATATSLVCVAEPNAGFSM